MKVIYDGIKDARHIESPLGRYVAIDGKVITIDIHKFAGENNWTLEVENDSTGDSVLFKKAFLTDEGALDYVLTDIEKVGIDKFLAMANLFEKKSA
jgi:hypothetical protein